MVFSTDDTKKLATSWPKHLSTTKRFSWGKMITRQMTPVFSSALWTLSVGTFYFCILRPSKFSSMNSGLCFIFWSIKFTALHAKDDNLKPGMGAQTRNLCYAYQIFGIKGMEVGVGFEWNH